MEIIGASLEANHEGTLQYEVINDEGNVSVLEGISLFMSEINFRLLIHKDHFMELQRLYNSEDSFTVNLDKSFLKLS